MTDKQQVLVRFYETKNTAASLNLLCALAEKADAQNFHKIFTITANELAAKNIDEALWNYKADFFFPHALDTAENLERDNAKMIIACQPFYVEEADLLINFALDDTNIDLPRNCKKIFEIFQTGSAQVQKQRIRYKNYQKIGIAVQYHNT
ncbi:MAG: DNA polymerase III subunit chi [Cardiobacteriaceae bacterium]|nr:DNA polymerase III subunit chi [Cardiobacteriaceae bacterium]